MANEVQQPSSCAPTTLQLGLPLVCLLEGLHGGGSSARPRTVPQRADTPAASLNRRVPSPRPSPHPQRGRGGCRRRCLPTSDRQRGSSQPADGASLRSQASGQQECQSEGNSRRGPGLSQLGLVHQGPSSKGQPKMRVASPGCRAGRQRPSNPQGPPPLPRAQRGPIGPALPDPSGPPSSLGNMATQAPPGRAAWCPVSHCWGQPLALRTGGTGPLALGRRWTRRERGCGENTVRGPPAGQAETLPPSPRAGILLSGTIFSNRQN